VADRRLGRAATSTCAIGSFIAPLIRYHKVDIAQASCYSMFVWLLRHPGLIFGGMLADRLTKRWPGGRADLSAVMFFIAAPLTYLAVDAGPGNPMGFAVPMALGVAASRLLLDHVFPIRDGRPSLRGMAVATYFCAMYLLGASLRSIVMGKLSAPCSRPPPLPA
jgi:hypothetical protein